MVEEDIYSTTVVKQEQSQNTNSLQHRRKGVRRILFKRLALRREASLLLHSRKGNEMLWSS